MAHGKTIRLYLSDGTAEGIVTAEIMNWNGMAIKIPRTEIAGYTKNDIQNAGVYFLFSEDSNGKDEVYIGESTCVLRRLQQHLQDAYYWHTAIVFVGKNLNKALIRYLEKRLCEIAKKAGRYTLLTKNTNDDNGLTESDIDAMEEFIDNIQILISSLNYKVLSFAPQPNSNTTYFYCNGKKGNKATGFISSGGFTVLQGATIANSVTTSCHPMYKKLRARLIQDGVIQNNTFAIDYEFQSPSAAASIVKGRNVNGQIDWKTETGVLLKDFQEN